MWYEIIHRISYGVTEKHIVWLSPKNEKNLFILLDYLKIEACTMHELKD